MINLIDSTYDKKIYFNFILSLQQVYSNEHNHKIYILTYNKYVYFYFFQLSLFVSSKSYFLFLILPSFERRRQMIFETKIVTFNRSIINMA